MNLTRTLGVDRTSVRGKRFCLVHNDCVQELMGWKDDRVHMICTSIPFGTQYEYCPSFNDFGHNPDNQGFWMQMDFLIPELLRVLKPGRICAVHVKDRIRFGNVTGLGFPTVEPFSDHCCAAFMKHGFHFMARITIDTDVVRENAQTYRLSWSEVVKDGTKMGAGLPEYVLVFRKAPSDSSDGYADLPVTKTKEEYTRSVWQVHASELWRSNGDRLPDPAVLMHMPLEDIRRAWIDYSLRGGYSHKEHIAVAQALEDRGKLPGSFMLFPAISRHPDVLSDIVRMDTLNKEQSIKGEEKHVCPLQLDIIERLIERYTNEREWVLDPFMGIGSVASQAVKMNRKAAGCELNPEYWRFSIGYAEAAESELLVPTLFDLKELKAA